MKIGLSGAGGVGKTTLIERIAPFLGYSVVPDVIDDVLKERGYVNFGDVSEDSERLDIRLEALQRKIDMENSLLDFISDKTVADYHAYWLLRSAMAASAEQNATFQNKVAQHIGSYDLIIIPKFGQFSIAENGLRDTNPVHQYRVHCLILGIYAQNNVSYQEFVHNLQDPVEKVISLLGVS